MEPETCRLWDLRGRCTSPYAGSVLATVATPPALSFPGAQRGLNKTRTQDTAQSASSEHGGRRYHSLSAGVRNLALSAAPHPPPHQAKDGRTDTLRKQLGGWAAQRHLPGRKPSSAMPGNFRAGFSNLAQKPDTAISTTPRSSGRPERGSRDGLSPSSCLRRRDPVPRNASRPDVGGRLAQQPEGAARTSSQLSPSAALQRARGDLGGRAPVWGWSFRGQRARARWGGGGKEPGRGQAGVRGVAGGHEGRGFWVRSGLHADELGRDRADGAWRRGRCQGAEREGARPRTGRCWDGRADLAQAQGRASLRVPVPARAKRRAESRLRRRAGGGNGGGAPGNPGEIGDVGGLL